MLGLIFATTFVMTNPYAPERCDTIELRQGEPFKEVVYVNSEHQCSLPGNWILELDGVKVNVNVMLRGDSGLERVTVQVLNQLPYYVDPSEVNEMPDDGTPVIFYIMPYMN